jgi:hypothetical protein
MIELFEFLNGCSPLRATSYMAFILIGGFITFAFFESIVLALFGRTKKEEETED